MVARHDNRPVPGTFPHDNDSQFYDPCEDGHSGDIYVQEFDHVRMYGCRRCGRTVKPTNQLGVTQPRPPTEAP